MTSTDILATEYFLEDLPTAKTPGTPLLNTIEAVAMGQSVSSIRNRFLQKQGYNALYSFVSGKLDCEADQLSARQEPEIASRIAVVFFSEGSGEH